MGFFLLIWALSAFGFLALASSMDKHQKQFFNGVLSAKHTQLAKILGWILLVLTLIISIIRYDVADGISYWVGVLSFAAAFVLLSLSYLQKHFKPICIGLGVVTAFGLVMLMI